MNVAFLKSFLDSFDTSIWKFSMFEKSESKIVLILFSNPYNVDV